MFQVFLFVCAAVAAAASHHAGVECLEHQMQGVVEPELGCPLNLCPPYTHCVVWGVGTFASPPVSAPPLPPFRTCSNGIGSVKNLEWVSDCSTPFLSPADLRASLAGNSLLIRGDSLLRHVFLRLVAHVRDEPTLVDPWFHEDALYSFNNTHDMLTLQGLTGGMRLVNGPTFVAAFQWDPMVKAVPRAHPFLPQWTLLVSAPIYWVKTDGIEELKALVASGAMVATTPSLGENNTVIRNSWVQDHTDGSFLPLDELATTGVFQRVDTKHYQCQSISSAATQTSGALKHPPSWDCSDPFNLNVVMMVVHRLRQIN